MGTPGIVVLSLAAVAGCRPAALPAVPPTPTRLAPAEWEPVVPDTSSDWNAEERRRLNDALYLVEISLEHEDPRGQLLRRARFAPSDRPAAIDEPLGDGFEATYSIRSGIIYLERPLNEFAVLAGNLAHELHHMERDTTTSVNRMQECDRERVAHRREARDLGRMAVFHRDRWPQAVDMVQRIEFAQAKAASLAGMYSAKFELFRVVQALDRVTGVRDLTDLYSAYEQCLDLAGAALSLDHRAEIAVLDRLSASLPESGMRPLVDPAIQRARDAVAACGPLEATVQACKMAGATPGTSAR